MLGEFITSSLVLVLGYAYPAFECFKTIEKNRVDIEELRFWCQYWIIVAVLRIIESFGDVFMAWLPMYSEAKLALIIYLWYPKTKGTGYIYDALLKPFVSKHEPDIDRGFLEFRARAFDLAIYYWHNCTELGQAKFFQLLDFIAAPSRTTSHFSSEQRNGTDHSRGAPPPSAPPAPPSSFSFSLFRRNKPSDRRQPPPSPRKQPPQSPPSYYAHRSTFHPSKPETVQVHPEDLSFLDTDYFEPGSDHAARPKYSRR
ncbi:putative HVA22-like protein g [Nicotiana tomentosiformis]|uniref:putative HVA22-like protein g n=1 Tax=Nicotiana tomentosiformis TaxID=4098 RepID=UPI00051ACCA1|nr:putative HVA22-like protein g [Nicotiana tomentosiformis]XP_009617379.1 putative HVA22-like protein g [Nicotiana tomentosiformis]